jgi:hypothetical protein
VEHLIAARCNVDLATKRVNHLHRRRARRKGEREEGGCIICINIMYMYVKKRGDV